MRLNGVTRAMRPPRVRSGVGEDLAGVPISHQEQLRSSVAAAAQISVVMPVRNESKTIDRLIRLVRLNPGVIEVLVIDDGSIDGTAEIAARAGAQVMMSSLLGKGASMEDGVRAARGEIIVFLDGDLLEVCDDLVERMTAPILSGQADMVKARFSRRSGRVTILTARPLISAFFPELARFDQPLGGIVAARRSLLRNLRLENDYGADVGLLIDAAMKGAQVVEADIGRIDHESRPLETLGDMAKQVTRVILDRAWRYDRLSINLVREMEETDRRAGTELPGLIERGPHGRRFALFDMDGVLLNGRFVVELADRVGAGAELSQFLDSKRMTDEDRTRAIAAIFTGVSQDVFEETVRSMPLMVGAVDTVVALRAAGYTVGIVTDSFRIAAETVRRRVFADFSVAQLMRFRNRTATGEVTLSRVMVDQTGCRRHDFCKSNVVRWLQRNAGLIPSESLAVGDGENDICMLREVALSIAFQPKSAEVGAAAKYTLSHSLAGVLDIADVARNSLRIEKPGSFQKAQLIVESVPAQ